MTELADRGEAWLVDRILGALSASGSPGPGEGPGDDAAVVKVSPASTLLLCIDTLTEGVHFRLDVSKPYDVGWKAVAVNLSDIAAMGGIPTHVVLAISAPPHMQVDDLDAMVAGAMECAAAAGARIVGGDTNSSSLLSLTGAALGRVSDGSGPVLRSGARPGDILAVTGVLGEAEVGRRAAFGEWSPLASEEPADLSRAVMRHRRPTARVGEGSRIAAAGASAMIDVSDGLLLDAGRLATASAVELCIDLRRVPAPGDYAGSSSREGRELLAAALAGGEDFELLFTIDPEGFERLEASWGDDLAPITAIGEVSEGEGVRPYPEDLIPPGIGKGGWEHFGPSGA